MRLPVSEHDAFARELQAALAASPVDLAGIALLLARLEYPDLDPAVSLDALDRLGDRARERVARLSGTSTRARVAALNALLFDEEGFTGDFSHYDDIRNNFLNAVLERRLGIPITLALVYMEVARRANVDVQGVAFPGHFLMRVLPTARASPRERSGAAERAARERAGGTGGAEPPGLIDKASEPPRASPRERSGAAKRAARERAGGAGGAEPPGLIIDPFDGGAELDVADCRKLLGRHFGTTAEDAPFDPALLRSCTARQMVARMLNNLKRTYLELRSFKRARMVTTLLLAVDPTDVDELRDRGLLALHLEDFPAALRDLEDYSQMRRWQGDPDPESLEQVLEHIKTARRKIAALN